MRKAGIWQGRFQYVHKGHYYVFKEELLKFHEKFVAIVNPNPAIPAFDYERFDVEYNPFTYFQRMRLWKTIADEFNTSINIFPCWHAKKYVELENDFLPRKSQRSWIVPVAQGESEERKAKDLQRNGEDVYEANFCDENSNIAIISASLIRASVKRGTNDYIRYIPESIVELTKDMINGVDNNIYYIVPFIDDTIDIASLQYAINQVQMQLSNGNIAYLIIAIGVKVNNNGENKWSASGNLPWWFYPAEHNNDDDNCTYYTRAQFINQIMAHNNEKRYLLTPLFIKKDNFHTLSDYCNSFLPTLNEDNVFWVLNNDIPSYYRYGFIGYLRNNQFNIHYFSSKDLVNVFNGLSLPPGSSAFIYNYSLSAVVQKEIKSKLKYKVESENSQLVRVFQAKIDTISQIHLGLNDVEKKQKEQILESLTQLRAEWASFVASVIGQLEVENDFDRLEDEFDLKKSETVNRLNKI